MVLGALQHELLSSSEQGDELGPPNAPILQGRKMRLRESQQFA